MTNAVGPTRDSFDLAPANFPAGLVPARRDDAESVHAAPSVFSILRGQWLTALLVSVFFGAVGVGAVWYFVQPKYEVAGLLHISPVVRPILFSDPSSDVTGNYRQYVGTQAVNIAGPAMIDATLALPEVRSLPTLATIDDPVSFVQDSLVVQQVQSSELLKVAMTGNAPKDMVAIVNALLRTYLKSVEEKQRDWDRNVLSSLKNEQNELETKLQMKNRQLRDAAVDQGLGGAQDSGTLVDRWLSDAHQFLTEARKNRELAAAKLEALGGADADPGTTNPAVYEEYVGRDPELLGLKEQLRLVEASAMSDAGQGRGPQHPEVLGRPALIEDLKDRIHRRQQGLAQAFAAAQRRELQAQVRDADITARVLENELKRLKEERANIGDNLFVLDDLRREREHVEASLMQVREKIWTVEVEQKRASQIVVDSWARVPPAPNLDKRPKLLAVAVMMSLACGAGVALLRGRMDRSIRYPNDVTDRLGVRVLGSVERIPFDKTAGPNDLDVRLVEPIRGISTALLAGSSGNGAHSRLVTSPVPGSGKSSMALNLARSLVATGRRVLLIDADNHGQGITRRLNLTGLDGLCEFLEGSREASALIQKIEPNGLHILPAGARKDTFGDLLRAKSTHQKMTALYGSFDEVIVDSPPVLVKSDAVGLATMVDEVVLVLRAGQTSHEEARIARQYLENVRGNVVGVILNAVDSRNARYGYGYSYSYAGDGS